MKKEGSVTVELKQNVKSVSKLLPGHYNLENIAKVMNTMFRRYGYRGLETEINQPLGQLVIKNLGANQIELDRDLQYCAKVMQTSFAEIHGFSWLCDEKISNFRWKRILDEKSR